ncbi:hypothetical protein CC80DRAFT_34095 [Byssothecium circinans]|uniref:Uncharacterized protein n=1 Tax=Byssothecium circinans TaxID=147558 RepID=A0A6A5U1U4_9PLEO|nr:hypothetical protein CC80DRAFT_34095 [Byssothecium circinans]
MPPPPPLSVGESRSSNLASATGNGFGYVQLSRLFILILLVVTGLRLAIAKLVTKKRRALPAYQPPHSPEKDTASSSCQARSEEYLRQHRQSPSKDQRPPFIKPIYPWISLPQPLPGPYDPRLFPPPTIRRHSYDPSTMTQNQNETVTYVRRVSTDTIPMSTAMLRGTVTTSTNGWRRNQWVVSGA